MRISHDVATCRSSVFLTFPLLVIKKSTKFHANITTFVFPHNFCKMHSRQSDVVAAFNGNLLSILGGNPQSPLQNSFASATKKCTLNENTSESLSLPKNLHFASQACQLRQQKVEWAILEDNIKATKSINLT